MTALTVTPPVPHWQKGVQARQRRERGRGEAALRDPAAWTVAVVVATGLALIARHPIAQAIGTEVKDASPEVSISAPARPASSAAHAPALALALPVAAAPTHAPRDPFRALVDAGGRILTAQAVEAGPSLCSGTTHRVVAGDTLWSIAARSGRTSDPRRVSVSWRRLYDANRAAIGADPSLLRVGTALCVPPLQSRG